MVETGKKPVGSATLTIRAIPPFDFDLTAGIFSDGDKQIRKYENGIFWQVIRVDDKLVLVTARALGTICKPKLSVELSSNKEICSRDMGSAAGIVCRLFDLEFDLRPFYNDMKRDKTLAGLMERMQGLKSPAPPTVFEALIDSIVEQQISLNVAEGIERRLIKAFGGKLKLDGNVFFAFPTPKDLVAASAKRLRSCGLSSRKAEYIRGISKLVAERKLDLEKLQDHESTGQIVSELDRVRGIGVWTAEMTMVRGMRKFEAFPADDLGLRRIISRYFCNNRKISAEEARRIAEKWGKWKGLVAFYLVMADWLEH